MLLCVSYIECIEAGACLYYSVSLISSLEKLEPVYVALCLLYRVYRSWSLFMLLCVSYIEFRAYLCCSVSRTSTLEKVELSVSLISSVHKLECLCEVV